MEQSTLRWGILSTARINQDVIPPLQKSPRHEPLAVASRDGEKAAAYARRWGIPRAYGSYAALLADPEIDVVYNPLPNSLHAEWTIKACQAGKHVLCEKPLAISLEEVDAVARAAAQAGVVVAEAFMYRHHPQTLRVKEMVDSGAVGELQLVRGTFTYTLRDSENIRLDPDLGGGSIWDVGCYPISYARYLAGVEPIEVFGWQTPHPHGVDVAFAGQMRFPGEVFAQFDCSFRSQTRSHIEVVGSLGSLEIPNPYKPGTNEQIAWRRGDRVEAVSMPGADLYLGEVEDMGEAILLGKAPRLSLADSRANVGAILALLTSAREGKPVALPAR